MIVALIGLATFVIILLALARLLASVLLPITKQQAPRCFVSLDNYLHRLSFLRAEHSFLQYGFCVLIFNIIGILFLYLLQRTQAYLPLNPQGFANVEPYLALNSAISFVTNTNVQNYQGGVSLSYLTQMLGMALQNFLSAASSICVAMILMRSFILERSNTAGNFFSDLLRICLYILLPLSIIYALFLISQGSIQSLEPYINYQDLLGHDNVIPQGAVASQEAIKLIGTNGGGYFNANSAHPFENASGLVSFTQSLMILLIPASLCYVHGMVLKDKKEGHVLLFVMTLFFSLAVIAFVATESSLSTHLEQLSYSAYNYEGKELRFSAFINALFSIATTAASCGAVNSMHDSLNPLSYMITMIMMQSGEIIFGGVGSGYYGMLIIVILTMFLSGLMIGKSPRYLGKRIGVNEIKLAALAMLVSPLLVLLATALACIVDDGSSLTNSGAHGFSEYLYAFTSAANNNGSAMAGLNGNTVFFNLSLAICMFVGRFVTMVAIIALAYGLARQSCNHSSSNLASNNIFFALLLSINIVLLLALSFIPSLALGPIAEHLSLFR